MRPHDPHRPFEARRAPIDSPWPAVLIGFFVGVMIFAVVLCAFLP